MNRDQKLLAEAYEKVLREDKGFTFDNNNTNHKPSFDSEDWIKQNVKNPNGGTS